MADGCCADALGIRVGYLTQISKNMRTKTNNFWGWG
jgi:hypothetical protein